MKKFWPICMTVLALSAATAFAQAEKKEAEKKDEKKEEASPAKTDAKEVAVIKTTEGEMVIEFSPAVAPKTVENFKALGQKGFYGGTAFHRIVRADVSRVGDALT